MKRSVIEEMLIMDPRAYYSETVLKFNEISIDTIDLIDDAWGFQNQFPDIFSFLNKCDLKPSESLLDKLFSMVEPGERENRT